MSTEELIQYYPELYHVTAAGSWPSIAKNGLLSTAAILDRLQVDAEERRELQERRRPESVTLVDPSGHKFVIRDQRPLHDGKLASCLQNDLTTVDWHRILNGKVFFWVRKHRFKRLLDAQAYRTSRQTIITVDTTRLVEDYEERIHLSPMNSGTTSPMAHERGLETFRQIHDYPFEERRRRRGPRDAIAELTVEYAVPDVAAMTVRVEEAGGGDEPELLWEP